MHNRIFGYVFVISTVLLSLVLRVSAAPIVRIDLAPTTDGVNHLSWDTEGGFVLTSIRGKLYLPFDPRVTSTCIIPAR
jgi:hypothetical protein